MLQIVYLDSTPVLSTYILVFVTSGPRIYVHIYRETLSFLEEDSERSTELERVSLWACVTLLKW